MKIMYSTLAAALLAGCGGDRSDAYDNPELKAVQNDTTQVSVFRIDLGDCLIDATDGNSVTEMDKIECSKPHLYEAYFMFDLPAGVYPGQSTVEKTADERCQAEFEGFVGKSFEESELTFSHLTPSVESWLHEKDREVICFLRTMDDSPMTGSGKGSGR